MNDEAAVGFVVKCTEIRQQWNQWGDSAESVVFSFPWLVEYPEVTDEPFYRNEQPVSPSGYFSLSNQPIGRFRIGEVYTFRVELEGAQP